jgi:hypothetical protein
MYLNLVVNNGLCASLDVAGAASTCFRTVPADAGTLTIDQDPVGLASQWFCYHVSATPDGNSYGAYWGYSVIYVLTSGTESGHRAGFRYA